MKADIPIEEEEQPSSSLAAAVVAEDAAEFNSFTLYITGQIESMTPAFSASAAYCKFSFVGGQDWTITEVVIASSESRQGLEEGISQTAVAGKGEFGPTMVWNFPLAVTWKSSTPFGWPQILLQVFSARGRSQLLSGKGGSLLGYGVAHIPVEPGRHEVEIPLFRPVSSTPFRALVSRVCGQPPELVNYKILADASMQGRELVQTAGNGSVNLKVNVVLQDFQDLGYRSKCGTTK